MLPMMYVGLSQLVYMIPAILIARRKGETETAKGLIVGASITFLLNATCNGLLFFNR
jgi:ABC-type Fe3+-siderophore transport system permease subunit